MKTESHAGALTDYCKNKIIPRGLHMRKAPGMFPHNEVFKERWAAILNKCSMDIMIYMIKTVDIEILQKKWKTKGAVQDGFKWE